MWRIYRRLIIQCTTIEPIIVRRGVKILHIPDIDMRHVSMQKGKIGSEKGKNGSVKTTDY
jgi:hypothetical protein